MRMGHGLLGRGMKAALLSGASLSLFFGAAAVAQETEQALEEIVVTGSRIARSNVTSPTPLNVVGEQEIRFSGYTNLVDSLENAPQLVNSLNAQSSGGFLFVGGQSRADLRGLGTNRTLVLVDGRRHVPGAVDSPAVDLNLIPVSMIERTEIITGGASAVYGSEAVAGVVNIILRKNFEGAEFDAQTGISEEGDGEEHNLATTLGGKFADGKGYLIAGIEYNKTKAILASDRDFAYPGISYDTTAPLPFRIPAAKSRTGTAGVFRTLVANPTGPLAGTTPAGVVIVPGSRAVRGLSATCLNPRNSPTAATPYCQDDALIYTADYATLQGEFERINGRAYAEYELLDNVKFYSEFAAARVEGNNPRSQPSFTGTATFRQFVRRDNAYLNGAGANAAELRRIFDANGLTAPTAQAELYRFTEEFGQRIIDQNRDMIRAVGGFSGDFAVAGQEFGFDTYYQYGEVNATTKNRGLFIKDRHTFQLDAVVNPANGQIVCRALLPGTDPALQAAAAGCVPWDFLNGPSQAAVNYSRATGVVEGQSTQEVAAINFTTDLFPLPAGDVSIAFGGEWRREASIQTPDAAYQQGLLFVNAIPERGGAYNVKEGYVEVLVPVLKDMFLAERLDVDAAYRYADYSTVNGVSQWKVGVDYSPVSDIRFRGTYSKSVRAPNIIELFAPQSENFTTAQQDPCDRANVGANPNRAANCAAAISGYNAATFNSNIGTGRSSLRLLQGGNPDLKEEDAKTYTIGGVFQPSFLENLSVTVDYYNIKIEDAVSLPSLASVFNQCYNSGVASACALIVRDPTGARTSVAGGIDFVSLAQANIASFDNSGIDFSINYDGVNVAELAGQTGDLGELGFRLDGTYLIEFDQVPLAGLPPLEIAGTSGTPRWRLAGTLSYALGPVSVSWQTRFESSTVADISLLPLVNGQVTRDPFYTGDYWKHDLRGTYEVTEGITLRGGVLNVTNEDPPQVPGINTGTGSGTSGGWDNRGRYFYGGINVRF